MSNLTEYGCQRERVTRTGYTHLRVAPGTERVVKRHPMIAPQASCGFVHVVSDGADAIEERVNGEETRGLWRGRDVILIITHRLFSRERRRQRCTTVLFSVTITLT